MRYAKLVSVLCGAFFAFATVGASSALAAKDNPLWALEGVIAGPTVKMAVEAEQTSEQKLKGGGLEIACKKLSFVGGEIIGSTLPESGKGKGKILYKECSVVGFPSCTINGKASGTGEIETQTLITLEAYASKAAAEAEALTTEETVTVFKPENTSTLLFAEFTLAGTCPVTGKVKVEGTGVVVKNLGKNESLEVHEIEAPEVAKTKYFEWSTAGVVTESKAKLEVDSLEATYSGKSKVKNANKEKYNLAI